MKFILATWGLVKKRVDRIHNERLRISLLQALPFWIASLFAGIVAVVYAELFSLAEELSLYVFKNWKWGVFVFTPVCFVIAVIIVKKFAPNARGSGIPQ
jgi:H+/Cl- antiporter ClcA